MDLFHSAKFAARVEDLMKEHHVPGMAIALVHHEETVSKGFGYARLEPKEPCTPNTIFDIASASKSLTAASVALLVEDDVVFLDGWRHRIMNALDVVTEKSREMGHEYCKFWNQPA